MSIKSYLFFLSFLSLISFSLCVPYSGSACDSINCVLPNCRCATTNIPGNLLLADVPQFIYITFDDSVRVKEFEAIEKINFLLDNPSIKDSLNCKPKPTFYVRQIETDFNIARLFADRGEVGVHTFSHTTNFDSEYSTWLVELKTARANLNRLGGIKLSDIKGSRAPYLQTNNDYFKSLDNLNILYDSSLIYSNSVTKLNYWAFTLDYPVPDSGRFCYFGYCPTESHPGVWEMPMINFDYDSPSNIMDPVITTENYATLLQKFKDNFDDSYNSNRVPRGIYTHFRYLSSSGDFDEVDTLKKNFYVDLLTYIVSKPNVVFASESDVIKWIRKPIKFSNLENAWTCTDASLTYDSVCSHLLCAYAEETFEICGSVCPKEYPGLGVKWNFLPPNGNPTNFNFFSFVGKANIPFFNPFDPLHPNAMCADGITLDHKNGVAAKAFILTIKICANLVKSVRPLYAKWFANIFHESWDNEGNYFLKIRSNDALVLSKNTNFNLGGFCISLKDSAALSSFSATTSVTWGLDFYNRKLTCETGQCKLFCGNGVCDSIKGETAITCPIDCSPQNYTCPLGKKS